MFDPNKIYEIPIDEILADSDFNVRGSIDPIDCIELSRDIARRGLDTPITVQPWDQEPGKKFRILAGHRRFKAHQLAFGRGVEKIPLNETPKTIKALVRTDLNEMDAHVLNITENIQRQNLNILQEAKGIEIFFRAGWTEGKVQEKLGMSRGWVQIRFMLLALPAEIQKEAAAGLLTQGQIRQCFALENPTQQFEFVREIKDKKNKGKVREVDPSKVITKNEKRVRTEAEIFKMQDNIRENILGGLNNEITRALGWAAGVVSDLEYHKSLQEYARRSNKVYMIPSGLLGTHAQVVKK